MSDLSSLIARLEAAEGPDRELDCHLWVVAQGGDARMNYVESESKCFVWERGLDGMWIRGVVNFRAVPSYTSSIDAAVSLAELVLPGWVVEHIGQDYSSNPPMLRGMGWCIELTDGENHSQGQSKGFAMAWVLATLRALQSRGDA